MREITEWERGFEAARLNFRDKIQGLESLLKDYKNIKNIHSNQVVRMGFEIDRLRDALKTLYEETADYIRINNLGDVHHNKSMQMARDALGKTEGQK